MLGLYGVPPTAVRLSAQNDSPSSLAFGTTTFHQGLTDSSYDSRLEYTQLYYRVGSDGIVSLASGNGISNNQQVASRQTSRKAMERFMVIHRPLTSLHLLLALRAPPP